MPSIYSTTMIISEAIVPQGEDMSTEYLGMKI